MGSVFSAGRPFSIPTRLLYVPSMSRRFEGARERERETDRKGERRRKETRMARDGQNKSTGRPASEEKKNKKRRIKKNNTKEKGARQINAPASLTDSCFFFLFFFNDGLPCFNVVWR
jgi:hypothetical protein